MDYKTTIKKLENRIKEFEGTHKRKNGSTFPVEVRIVLFESAGEKYMLGIKEVLG